MNYQWESFARDMIVLATFIGFFAWIIYLGASTFRRKQQNTMQKHVLDKFSSAQDFAEFVQSPAGQKYVMSFSEAVTSPRNSILSSVKIGIVLIFLGAGFYSVTRNSSVAVMFGESFGAVLTCLGFGFLISAAVSYWLAKKIGLGQKE